MKPVALLALMAAMALLLALNVVAFAQGTAPTPTPDAMMMQATATSDTMMMQATATSDAMMMAATATPAAMMDQSAAMTPSTLPVTGANAAFPWPAVLAAGAAAVLAGFGLRLARTARQS